MNRRGFLKAMLASAAAPYVVTNSGVLMPLGRFWTFGGSRILTLCGDGVTDDSAALQAWLDGGTVLRADGTAMGRVLTGGSYRIGTTIYLRDGQPAREMVRNMFIGPVREGPMIHISTMDDVPIRQAQIVSYG